MSFSSVVDISATSWQYSSEMMTHIDMPELGVFATVQGALAQIGRLASVFDDFRLYFSAVAVGAPLAMILLGIAALNSLRTIIWYILLLVSVLLTLIGAVGNIVIASVTTVQITLSDFVLLLCLIIGPCLFALCMLALWFRESLLAFGAEPRSDKETVEERMKEETEGIAVATLLMRLLLTGAFAFFGLVFVKVIGGAAASPFDTSGSGFAPLAAGFGYAFLGISGLLLIHTVIGLFQCGREFQWRAGSVLEENFLRVFLIVWSILYIVIVSPLFLVYNCNEFTCPRGTRLRDDGSVMPAVGNGSTTDVCVPCAIAPGQRCPLTLQATACVSGTEERLESDRALRCADMRTFFWPAASIMIVAVVLGVPLIFYDLISQSVATLSEKFPIRDVSPAELAMKKRKEEEEEKQKKEQQAAEAAKSGKAAPPVPAPVAANKYAPTTTTTTTPGDAMSPRNGGEGEGDTTGPAPAPPTAVPVAVDSKKGVLHALGAPDSPSAAAAAAVTADGDEADPESAEYKKWRKQVLASQNVSKFLYQPFLPSMRYTRLFFLIQKLVSVFLTQFVIKISTVDPRWIQVGSNIGVHTLGFIVVALTLPFLYAFENGLTLVMELLLTATGVLSVLVFAAVEMPDWVLIAIIISNVVLPIVALVIAIILEWSSSKSDEEEEERKKQRELKDEIEQRKKEQRQRLEKQRAEEEEQRQKEAEAQKRRDFFLSNPPGTPYPGDAVVAVAATAAAAAAGVAIPVPAGSAAVTTAGATPTTREQEPRRAASGLDADGSNSGSDTDGSSGTGSSDDDDASDNSHDDDDADLGDDTASKELRDALKALSGEIAQYADLEKRQQEDKKTMLQQQQSGGIFASVMSAGKLSAEPSTAAASDKASVAAPSAAAGDAVATAESAADAAAGVTAAVVEMKEMTDAGSATAATTTAATAEGDAAPAATEAATEQSTAPAAPPPVTDAAERQRRLLASLEAEKKRLLQEEEERAAAAESEKQSGKKKRKKKHHHHHHHENGTPPSPQSPVADVFSPPPNLPHQTGDESDGDIKHGGAAAAAAAAPATNLGDAFTRGAPSNPAVHPPPADPFAGAWKPMQQATSFGTVSWGQKPSPPSAASPTLASSPSGLQREDSGSGKKPRRRGSRRKSNAAAAAGELVPSATELINQESDAIFLMEDGSGFEDLGVEENGSGVVVTDKDLPEDFAFMSKQEQIAVRRKIIKKKQALAEKRAAKLRRLEELLEQRRREAEQRLLICQSNVDYEINQVVKSRLNCALMLQGVLGLVALALCAVALLSSPSVVITVTGGVASATAARSNATEFLGYNTWEAFVDSCCCTSAVNTNSTATAYVAVEKWICANGKVKERVRAYRPNLVTSGGSDRTVEDGYAARTLCNVSFATGCGLQVVTSTSGATPATSSLRVACRAGITVTASMESFW